MIRLRWFGSVIEANAAVMYLAEHGVRATVVGHHSQDIQGAYHAALRSKGGAFELLLLDPARRADAELILESFEAEPVELEPGWEAVAEGVDLGRLDPEACAIACAACGAALPLDAEVEACPACAAPVDILRRLLEVHGPEALADALPDEIEEPE